jgi:hypothetical protein
MQIHFQLATLKKGGSSIGDYYQKFKSLSDGLVAAIQSLYDYESFSFLLSGLSTESHSVVASLSTLGDTMPIEDLYSHLLIHKQRLEHHSSTTHYKKRGLWQQNIFVAQKSQFRRLMY